jgi:hypothetical protein
MILIMIVLMVIGLASIILYIITKNAIPSVSEATKNALINDLQCHPHTMCPSFSDDSLWSNTKDVKIVKGRSGYQDNVARQCSDLITRVINAKKTTKIISPPALTLQATFNDSSQPSPVFGALWTDNKGTVWVVFRGTLTIQEWKDDFAVKQEALPESWLNSTDKDNPVQVHSGFLSVYNTFRTDLLNALKKINPNMIVVTGHSLGAGVSTLCAVDLATTYPNKVVSYTFAAPRVGNEKFCDIIDQRVSIYRIVNNCDIVPTLPTSVSPNFVVPTSPFLYQHGGIAFMFALNKKSLQNNHVISAYINGLDKIST